MNASKIALAATFSLLAAVSQHAKAVELVGFNEPSSFVLLASVNTPTSPIPLSLTLNGPALFDTFISVASSDSVVLGIAGGGVTIPTGLTSASLYLNALQLGTATLTAQLGLSSATATVEVVNSIPSVPEPSTLVLMALGSLVLVGTRVRRIANGDA